MSETTRFAFLVDWLDMQASLVRQFMLFYYPVDKTIEMDDLKNRRKFLRRGPAGDVNDRMLFVGATVTVHGRQLTVKDYADDFTRKRFQTQNQRTFCLILPEAGVEHLAHVLNVAHQNEFRVGQLKMLRLQPAQARQFQSEISPETDARSLTSGGIVVLEIVGVDAVRKWSDLSARMGSSVIALNSEQAAENAIDFFFGGRQGFAPTAQIENSSLLVIKPSAVARGDAGKILLKLVQGGFDVSGLQMFALSRANAEELLEVYKGVVPAYASMVDEFVSSACIAVAAYQPRSRGSCVQPLRDLVGPADPELARLLRPQTIRAEFGKDPVDNAVHSTDLEEDAQLEVEYFFKLLQ